MVSRQYRYLFAPLFALLLLLISACGFHLQTTHPLPPQLYTLYFKSRQPYHSLSREIKSTLQQLHVTLVCHPSAAPFTLDILAIHEYTESIHSNLSSISTRPYLLTSSLTFTLTRPNGSRMIAPLTISASRHFILPGNVLLDNNDEEQITKTELHQTLIELLLDRLNSTDMRVVLHRASSVSSHPMTTRVIS